VEEKIKTLEAQIGTLERLRRNVICGRMDSDLLINGVYTYPMGCQPIGGQLLPDSAGAGLKATLTRPGVFSFEFNPPRPQKPIVLVTVANAWGSVPVESSNLRVSNVNRSGFTVESFDPSANPTSVGFFFVVLSDPNQQDPTTKSRRGIRRRSR
jgi:hypothetical protein